MFGGGPASGQFLSEETRKPKNTGETLARLAKYFGRWWPMLLLCAGLHRRLDLGAGDHARTDRAGGGLLPDPRGSQRLWQFCRELAPGELLPAPAAGWRRAATRPA